MTPIPLCSCSSTSTVPGFNHCLFGNVSPARMQLGLKFAHPLKTHNNSMHGTEPAPVLCLKWKMKIEVQKGPRSQSSFLHGEAQVQDLGITARNHIHARPGEHLGQVRVPGCRSTPQVRMWSSFLQTGVRWRGKTH